MSETKTLGGIGQAIGHPLTYNEPTKLEEIPEYIHVNQANALIWGIDKALGDILTVIDILGLPENQHKALKKEISEAFYKRYTETADKLLQIVFTSEKLITPNSASSKEVYTPNQNKHIARYGWAVTEFQPATDLED